METKRKWLQSASSSHCPTPERYNDPIEIEEVMESPKISLISSYYWENDSWIPQQKYGFEQEGNNITVTFQVGDREMERSVYTYDDQKRIVAYTQYQDTEKRSEVTYSYNNDGLLNKKDENGIVTLYIYSKHEVTGIEKTTVSVLQIKGRIITTDNAETLLQVYTIDGTLIASGTGTVTLPEKRNLHRSYRHCSPKSYDPIMYGHEFIYD